jgi:predicted lipid carrier protein YhbT
MVFPIAAFTNLAISNFSLPPSPREFSKQLPKLLLKPVSYLPFPVQRFALGNILKLAFKDPLAEGDLDFLQGRWLKIEVQDLDLQWLFSCGPQREVLMRKHGISDVCIRGELKSFVLLAAQKEDPDTLFFQRNLVIEGDTDLGLEVKNLLDSLELDELPPELLFAVRSGAEYMTLFSE